MRTRYGVMPYHARPAWPRAASSSTYSIELNARARIFAKDRDYQTFEQIMAETAERGPVRILAYYLMPNYWHH